MIEEIWNAFPLPINPREASRTTFHRRGRKGGTRRVQEAKEARAAQGDRESGATDTARGALIARDAAPP